MKHIFKSPISQQKNLVKAKHTQQNSPCLIKTISIFWKRYMNKCQAVEEHGLARLFLQRHQTYFRCSYQLQSRGMKTVLHYGPYMCKQFSNPAGFIKNVNHKLQ